MISPIGTFLQDFDANITAAMNAGVTGLTAYMATPVQTVKPPSRLPNAGPRLLLAGSNR